jgi:hypothetical protein
MSFPTMSKVRMSQFFLHSTIGKLTFDHDPRWVGSPSGRDFPSALLRFLLCLGIEANLCPPRRPDLKGYVERLIKSYQTECVWRDQPATEEAAREVTEAFLEHYHHERPHQGRGLGHQPPRLAFPTLPTRSPLPAIVDPDRWLQSMHGRGFARTVHQNGSVVVDHKTYYVKQALAGRKVVLIVNAPGQCFDVLLGRELVKSMPVKGLVGQPMPFEAYAERMRGAGPLRVSALAPAAAPPSAIESVGELRSQAHAGR